MGINVQASYTKQSLKDFTDTINSVTTTAIQNVTQNCDAINIGTFNLGGEDAGCATPITITGSTININQTSANGCKLNATQNTTITDTDYNTIKIAAQEYIKNELDNSQGWLAIGISVQTSTNISSQDIINRVNNMSITDVSQTCNAYYSAYNDGTVNICANVLDSTIDFNQNSAVTGVTTCTSNSILKYLFETTELQQFAQNTDNHFASTQSGIGSLFGWIIAIVVGIIIIALIIGVVFLFSGSGEKNKEPNKTQLIRREELEGRRRFESEGGLSRIEGRRRFESEGGLSRIEGEGEGGLSRIEGEGEGGLSRIEGLGPKIEEME